MTCTEYSIGTAPYPLLLSMFLLMAIVLTTYSLLYNSLPLCDTQKIYAIIVSQSPAVPQDY